MNQQTSGIWMGTDLSDAEFAALVEALLRRDDVSLLPEMLVIAARHPAFWESDAGQAALAEMLALLLDAFEAGDASGALAAMETCPPRLARQALDLLVAARFADGDAAQADDATLLCIALLLGASGRRANV